MKYSIIFTAVLIFFVSQRIQAQQVTMSSSLTRDVTTGEMVGFSRTEMDFNTAAWYQAYVSNEIRRQSDNGLLASGDNFSTPGTNTFAARTSRTAGVANVTYRLDSKHWILPLSFGWCTFSPQDVYSYATTPGVGGNFGATQVISGFFCSGPFCGVCVGGWIYLGQTTQSKTIPNVAITNPRIGTVPGQSTQTALLGADVVLSSSVTPTGGGYSWTFTGPFSISAGSTSGSSVTIRSSNVGAITARLTYTVNGVPNNQQFTINAVLPTMQSFTAQQVADSIAAPSQCDPNKPWWTYRIGCGGSNPGITFSATAQVSPSFISDPTQSGIKIVQAVSTYRKKMVGGNLRCFTARSDPSNVTSGWQLDFSDPYPLAEVRRFSEGNTLTIRSEDTPSDNLTFAQIKEFVDALDIDDRFETYLVYFTFDPANPPISRTLGKLEWVFGGFVAFDNPGAHRIRFTRVVPGQKTGQAATFMVTRQGRVQDNQEVQCPGAPPLTKNPIDASRYFVRQHYIDFLGPNRDPDLSTATQADKDGWNHWTSEITRCAFDFNCIHFERMHIGHAFFLVAPSVLSDPDLANPPGSPGFNAATYNRAFVKHCYINYLRRYPDPDGWNHWTNELNSDGNYWHILDAFQLSPEYRNRFCQFPLCSN